MATKAERTIQHKMKILEHSLANGFGNQNLQCVYRPLNGDMIRLNFRDQKALRLEVKVMLTQEEKEKRASEGKQRINAEWRTREEAPYLDVEIKEGGLNFKQSKKKITTKAGE